MKKPKLKRRKPTLEELKRQVENIEEGLKFVAGHLEDIGVKVKLPKRK